MSGFNGDLGDFTLDINAVQQESRTSTDLNALLFDPAGNFLFAVADLNQFSGNRSRSPGSPAPGRFRW